MRLDGNFEVNAPRTVVWERITDPALMVGCIPGCEEIEQVDAKNYKAVVAVSLGIIKARFHLAVQITGEDPPNAIHATTSGEEGTRASTVSAANVVTLSEVAPDKTRVEYVSEVSLSGRLGKYGLGMMRKRATAMSDEFAANFRRKLEGAPEPATAAAPSKGEGARWRGVLGWLGVGTATDRPDAGGSETRSPSSEPMQSARVNADRSVLRPATVDDAIGMLSERAQSYPLSGGATLIAMKNAGLVDAQRFVSLEAIEELCGIEQRPDGSIRIGAMARHRDTAACEHLTGTLEVVRQAASVIANPVVRNMGTIGGSLANADPAADYLPALVCTDAQVEIAGAQGRRRVAIGEFLTDWYTTALEMSELITAIELPAARGGYSAYRKVARVSGDFATASCAVSAKFDDPTPRAGLAIGACGPYPVRDRAAEKVLSESAMNDDDVAAFAARLVALSDPIDDVRGSADYRRLLIPRLVAEALAGLAAGREAA